MSLEEQAKNILDNFEESSPEKILEVLKKINPLFKSELTVNYLQGKLEKIIDIEDNSEKKKQCKSLRPYIDWYVQGLNYSEY